MKKHLPYRELARYYDLIYSEKDYEKEAADIISLVKKYKRSAGNELLDVACGTGKHLIYLRKKFSCTGVDISGEMLSIAKARLKDVAFEQADMVEMDLHRQFDVMTCLFSSIGYVKTYARLERAISNFAHHLRTGGVLIVEPWFTKDVYEVGSPHMNIYDGDDMKIARLHVSKVRGDISVLEMNYLIAEKGEDVKHFTDTHELCLFETGRMLKIMREAGFEAEYLKKGSLSGRGMFVCVKK